jgi:type VI secretion system secreted protein Hcp
MAGNDDKPASQPEQVQQRYRFRVVAPDGREVSSQVVTVKGPTWLDVPARQILVAIQGQTQGVFKAQPGLQDQAGTAKVHQLSTDELEFATLSPRDAASGLPTGQRQHEPVRFTIATGPATPQFFQALASNESLKQVVFDCYGTDPSSGKPVLAHAFKLTNALVAGVEFTLGDGRQSACVSLTCQKLETTHGSVTALDDWSA